MIFQEVAFDGNRYQVDACGFYYKLLDIPLTDLEPTETAWPKDSRKVARYAQMYRDGSPFPPIIVHGLTPDHLTYAISNGHHRWLAAKLAGCESLSAWTCFYVDKSKNGRPIWSLARMSETEEGRALAHHLGREWCPRCGQFLNYHGGDACESCRLYLDSIGKEQSYAR